MMPRATERCRQRPPRRDRHRRRRQDLRSRGAAVMAVDHCSLDTRAARSA
jgi:hypothetical protein